MNAPLIPQKSCHSLIRSAAFAFAAMAASSVFATTAYVSTTGDDSTAVLDDSETPYKTVFAAISALGPDGGTVQVAKGEYSEQTESHTGITIAAPVKVVGETADPDETVIKYAGYPGNFIVLDHAGAGFYGVTLRDGRASGAVQGLGVKILENGGTISNCVVRNCSGSGYSMTGGGIYCTSANGVISHTIVRDCVVGDENRWGGDKAAGIHVVSGHVDNCLVLNCYTTTTAPAVAGYPKSAGGIYAGTDATVENCTVVNCRGTMTGGIWATKNCSGIVNCVAVDCGYPGEKDSGAGALTWAVTAAKFTNFATDEATAPAGTDCIAGVTANDFADYANGDYTPAVGGKLYNTGKALAGSPSEDLARNARVFADAIDIGAYEQYTSASLLVVGNPENIGTPSVDWGVHTDLSGAQTITIQAAVTNEAADTITGTTGWGLYVKTGEEWSMVVSGSGTTATFTVPSEPSMLEWTFAKEFAVATDTAGQGTVSDVAEWVEDGGTVTPVVTPAEGWYFLGWESGSTQTTFTVTGPTTFKALFLPVGIDAPVQYVSKDGNNENDGFTPESAKANPQAALTLLKSYGTTGGVMHVAPGTYRTPGLDSSTPSLLISTPISIIGDTGNPDDVLFEHGGASEFLVLDNAAASLSSVTLTNGYTSGQFASSGVKILAGGGTVTNCVIENCVASNGYQNRGVVYITSASGLLTHTIIRDNTLSDENRWGGIKAAVYATAGRIENCLIENCGTTTAKPAEAGYPRSAGGIYASGTALVRNCTVVQCRGTKTGGIWIDGSDARVVNCVAFDCDYPGEKDTAAGEKCWAGAASGFDHCATGEATAVNATCVAAVAESAFYDYASGDYRPLGDGLLYNAGTEIPEFDNGLDLAGRSRLQKSKLDIGCYECQALPPTILFAR